MDRKHLDEETRWQAVAGRDERYDGVFFFGVRSTGIFCRPGCPARRPRREQVIFFESPQAARAAGYRPCKRCRPEKRAQVRQWIEQARRELETAEEPLTLDELARRVGASPYHLHRKFKEALGLTPRQYYAACRLDAFKTRLQAGDDVTTALYAAGYGSPSRLYEAARKTLGMTPRAYRDGGKGMNIRYTMFESPLGRTLLAATQHGVCKVSFGEDDDDLEAQLKSEFPRAEKQRDDRGLSEWAGQLKAQLLGKSTRPDLPLDAQGTVFQKKVWAALRQIPYGQTRTYAQLAEAIGQPSAVRAAARACATNPVAILTPCHRVVRSDGSLGGYRWGLERKKELLQKEKGK